MEEKKLFLLDAYALIYRAYYALMRSPRVTSAGFNTSAIFGFVNTLEDLIKKENPGYLAVCFDPAHGRTFRHEQYPQYKAGRDKQPEDITLAIPFIKKILKAYRIPVIEVEGYEADDLIGTLSRRAGEAGFTTYMMTMDKDYGQLVNDRVFMYRPALKGKGFEIRGPQQICERYGISSPSQVIDLLALEGDASDNIPGCPGVGEKTAVKLIAEFGSVENMFQNTGMLKGALRFRIIENADNILMSRELATIITDVPIDIELDSLRRCEPDVNALIKIYKELEFKSFIDKLTPVVSEPVVDDGLFGFCDDKPVTDISVHSHEIEFKSQEIISADELDKFLCQAVDAGDIAMSINSVGAEAMKAKAYGIAFAFLPVGSNCAVSAYVDFGYVPEAKALIAKLLENTDVTIVGSDIKRDMLILRRLNMPFAGAKWFDTAVAHYLCQAEKKHDLASLAMNYLDVRTDDYDRPSDRSSAPLDPLQVMCQQAVLCLRLMPLLRNEVEDCGLLSLLNDVELPLIEVLADMEWQGARIDSAELLRLSNLLTERLHNLEQQAYALAGRQFNVSSPAQVGQILFDEMHIDPKARKTKGGAWSTAEEVLEKYASSVPLVKLILDIRGIKKLLATYIDALPKLINPRTGKLHTTYNQTVTATGRLSSTNPNLQNIPIRTSDGRDIRRAFIADPGCLLLSADYSQIELRLMADMSGDKTMIDAFLSGEDIHRATAAKIYHKSIQDVTDTQRRNAKTANFGIIYGISPFGLSERLGIPRAEAKALIDGYLATYPRVAEYMNDSIERARRDGFVTTILGRRRYLPDINSRSNTVRAYAERNAINAPLQGSAADVIKLAMVEIANQIRRRKLRSRMILQVHDELIFNVCQDELDEMKKLVVEGMEKVYNGRVPLTAAAGVANNWLDAH